jgi:hypothetical protein
VVDASKGAVSGGQTCPADLAVLLKRGVRIYSEPKLHAKVFVAGKTAYIGSANASQSSADTLIEAAVRTTESSVVRDAREFVLDGCIFELGPRALKELSEVYQPPKGGGGAKGGRKQPSGPRLLFASLILEEWSDSEQQLYEKGLLVARSRRENPRSWDMEAFPYYGKCPFEKGDVVMQILDVGKGRLMAEPPGNVIHVLSSPGTGGQEVAFVYVERPADRRRQLKRVAHAVGCSQAELFLHRDRVIREGPFKRAVLKAWNFTL